MYYSKVHVPTASWKARGGLVSQKLQTQECSWRNSCHWSFPVKKNFQNSQFPHSPSLLWQNKARAFIFESFSVPVFVYVFKIQKHKLIPKCQEKGVQPPWSPGSTPNTHGIQHWWAQRDISVHTQVCYPDFSYSQLKSPKEFVLRIHCEEQLWTYATTFMTEGLRSSKREREPQTYACCIKEREEKV